MPEQSFYTSASPAEGGQHLVVQYLAANAEGARDPAPSLPMPGRAELSGPWAIRSWLVLWWENIMVEPMLCIRDVIMPLRHTMLSEHAAAAR